MNTIRFYHKRFDTQNIAFYSTHCCYLVDVGYCRHCVDITCEMTYSFAGQRLNDFAIRVGNDVEVENNTICYEQFDPMPPMPSGVTKIFNCSSWIFGSWVSIDKTGQLLHFQEIRVYGGKYKTFWLVSCISHITSLYRLFYPYPRHHIIFIVSLKPTTTQLFVQQHLPTENIENKKAPHYWPFVSEIHDCQVDFSLHNGAAVIKSSPCHDAIIQTVHRACYKLACVAGAHCLR